MHSADRSRFFGFDLETGNDQNTIAQHVQYNDINCCFGKSCIMPRRQSVGI